jgi:predicted GNAT superfamily acetyltransferase
MSAAPESRPLEIRTLHEVEQFRQCVDLQRDVWNFAEVDLVPIRMFVVAEKVGGHIIGAYDENKLVGFALAVPGVRGNQSYLHSHMLAVRADYRNRGLGRSIKLFQREHAIKQGFDLIEWTFDPLEIKNSHLNIERLGVIARRYNINQYGITSSPLQGGLPTDRLIAEWWLQSRRVQTLLRNGSHPPITVGETIEVPGAIYAWKATDADRPRAAELQLSNRQKFLRAFQNGLAVLGYERDGDGSGRFLLGRWDEDWSLVEPHA